MPACICPHCKTPLWVNPAQLNVAQGFVVCKKCEGLFKAKDHPAPDTVLEQENLPAAVTDVRLVHDIGAGIRNRKQLSRNEIADLLDGVPIAAPEEKTAAKEPFNWTLASLVALTVLIIQLFYLAVL